MSNLFGKLSFFKKQKAKPVDNVVHLLPKPSEILHQEFVNFDGEPRHVAPYFCFLILRSGKHIIESRNGERWETDCLASARVLMEDLIRGEFERRNDLLQ